MIEEYRKKMGYTQEKFAEILNISTRQLQRIENNESYPRLETLKKIIINLKMKDKDIVKLIKEDIN